MPHRLEMPPPERTSASALASSSNLMYAAIAPAIADASFLFLSISLPCLVLGKGGGCIYSKTDCLFVPAVFYPVRDAGLVPENVPFF